MRQLLFLSLMFLFATDSHAQAEKKTLFPIVNPGKLMPEFEMPHLIPTREAFRRMKLVGLEAMKISFQAETDPFKKSELADFIAQILSMRVSTIEEAVSWLEKAISLIENQSQDKALDLKSKLAIAHLQISEIENCRHAIHGHSCVFPFSMEAHHVKKDHTKVAQSLFKEYLKKRPQDNQIKWLLLVASMALDEKPPKKWRLEIPKQTKKFPQFITYAFKAGIIKRPIQSGGAIIEDFTNDGCPDIVYSSTGEDQPVRFYQGNCSGQFEDATKKWGLDQQFNVINLSTTDFNNDGKKDLYLHRGGWFTQLDGLVKNGLLKNTGEKFVEVTKDMGLDTGWNANVSSSWLDYNNDGRLDLFVCQERRFPELFENRGSKFVEVAEKVSLTNSELCKGSAVGDVNNDGYLDIYISNYTGVGRLFLNSAKGTFTEDKQSNIVNGSKRFSFGTFFFDYNNDGWEDLFIATLVPLFEDALIDLFHINKAKRFDANLRLLENQSGTFVDVTKKVGLNITTQTMGLNFGDLDGDGFMDIYLGTGSTPYGSLSPNRVFRNLNGKKFEEVTYAGGFGNLQKGHGISFGDLNLDGHNDVLMNLGGHVEASEFVPELLINPGSTNNWVRIQLNGKKSNRLALGTRIRLTVTTKGKEKQIFFRVGGTGSYGQNSTVPLIGIGRADKIIEAQVSWLGSGLIQSFKDLPINRWVSIDEGDETFKELALPNKTWMPN